MKEILLLERVQRQATKFILNNYTTDYKTRLTQLNLLPLMYVLEFHDILFLIKSLKTPTGSFNVYNRIRFNDSHTRSSSSKLHHKYSDNVVSANSYFCRISRLWNVLPIIDLYFYFLNNFDPNNNCTLYFYVLAEIVVSFPVLVTLMFCKYVSYIINIVLYVSR